MTPTPTSLLANPAFSYLKKLASSGMWRQRFKINSERNLCLVASSFFEGAWGTWRSGHRPSSSWTSCTQKCQWSGTCNDWRRVWGMEERKGGKQGTWTRWRNRLGNGWDKNTENPTFKLVLQQKQSIVFQNMKMLNFLKIVRKCQNWCSLSVDPFAIFLTN